MYKNLHYKIILIFVIFTITLMTAIGAILIGSAYHFYNNDFIDEMEDAFSPDGTLYGELVSAFGENEWYRLQREILSSYSSTLGINKYRNYFILDRNGNFLDGSDARLGEQLERTDNIISAMAGNVGSGKQLWTDYIDYALPLSDGENTCIIYIRDSQEEARSFATMIFQITVQALFIGLAVAVVLSFFLAKAITAPIQSLTRGAQKIAKGYWHNFSIHLKQIEKQSTHACLPFEKARWGRDEVPLPPAHNQTTTRPGPRSGCARYARRRCGCEWIPCFPLPRGTS